MKQGISNKFIYDSDSERINRELADNQQSETLSPVFKHKMPLTINLVD